MLVGEARSYQIRHRSRRTAVCPGALPPATRPPHIWSGSPRQGTRRCPTESHQGWCSGLEHALLHPCARLSSRACVHARTRAQADRPKGRPEAGKGRVANAAPASTTSRAQYGWGTIASPSPSMGVTPVCHLPGGYRAVMLDLLVRPNLSPGLAMSIGKEACGI